LLLIHDQESPPSEPATAPLGSASSTQYAPPVEGVVPPPPVVGGVVVPPPLPIEAKAPWLGL